MGLIEASAQSRTFHTLDGLRGLAAIAVLTLHYQSAFGGVLLPGAYLAVDLFFMMSGIVIAHAYDRKFAQGLSVGRFLLVRTIRLFPMYLLGWAVAVLLVCAALATGVSNWTLGAFIPAAVFGALMLPNFVPVTRPDLYPMNAPAWSLLWEMIVNAAYAAAFRWLSVRVLATIAAISAAAVALLGAVHGNLDSGAYWNQWYGGLIRVTFAFTLGVILERLRAAGRLDRFGAPAPLLLLVAGAGLALPQQLGWAKDVILVLLVFPAICVAAIARETKPNRFYAFLGLISYPLYVTHIPIPYGRLFTAVTRQPADSLVPFTGFVLLGMVLVGSLALARWYDAPVRRYLTRVILGRSNPRSSDPEGGAAPDPQVARSAS